MKKEKVKDIIPIIIIMIVGTIFIIMLCERVEEYDKTHPVEKSPAYYNNELMPGGE